VKQESYQETDADWEVDDDLRIEEIRSQSTPNSPWSPWRAKSVPVGRNTRRAARMAVVPAILLLALFRLVVGDGIGISSESPGYSQRPLDLLALGNDVGCLVDVAWSPDGQQIAVLAYRFGYTCADEQRYVPAQLTIYGVSPVAVLSRIQVDKALISKVHPWPEGARAPAPTCNVQSMQGFPRIRYYDLLWSRDGQRLAVRFSAVFPPCLGALSQSPHAGALTLDEDGKQPKVVQFDFAASTQLTSLWDREQTAETDGTPSPTPRAYGYSTVPDAYASGSVIAVSPDGREIASYSVGGTVDLYDSASGDKITSLSPQVGRYSYSGRSLVLLWSPDGMRLLLASGGLGSVTVWAWPLRALEPDTRSWPDQDRR
jgi:hypothetical protein